MAQHQMQHIIDNAWDNRANINGANATHEVREAVDHVISELNGGRLRVATREGVGQWTVHQWIKKSGVVVFQIE